MTSLRDSYEHELHCRYCGVLLTDENCERGESTRLRYLCRVDVDVFRAYWKKKAKELWPAEKYEEIGTTTDGRKIYVKEVVK